jgi:hypothetical protein
MNERFHECATSSNFACPSANPATVFSKTNPDGVAKPYSTPKGDEYPVGDASCPTTNGTISKPWEPGESQYPPHYRRRNSSTNAQSSIQCTLGIYSHHLRRNSSYI